MTIWNDENDDDDDDDDDEYDFIKKNFLNMSNTF